MSWLFGKKKHHKDSPPDCSEEEQSSEALEGFVVIKSKGPPPLPPNTALPEGTSHPTGGLYPYIGQVPKNPTTVPMNLPAESSQGEFVPYLNGVPFKMCKRLERAMNNDLDIDILRINEILSFIERIENQNTQYDFSLEDSVVAEMNSTCNQ